MSSPRAVVAATILALLTACGADEPDPAAAPPTTTTTAPPPVVDTVDWAARTLEVAGLEGYTITFCEGEAPLLCIDREGTPAGVLELTSYPVSSIDVLATGDLTAWTEDFAAALARDRRDGCGDRYLIEGDEPEPAALGGATGVRYRVTGTVGGRVVERVVGVAAVVGDQLWLLAGNALEPDGCVSRESELLVEDLDRLTPTVLALAAASELPPSATTDTGWLRGRRPGVVTIDAALLSGDEAAEAAREDGAPEPPTDFYIDDDEPSTRDLRLGPGLAVELYDCSAGCVLRAVPPNDFIAGRVQPFGGPEALVSLVVRDDEVVRITEVYLP